MEQMSGMIEGCSKMMQSANPGGSGRPNEQRRRDAPQDGRTPDTNGWGRAELLPLSDLEA